MIPKKQLLLITAVISIFLIAGGFLYYQNEAKTIRQQKYNELKAIAELERQNAELVRFNRLFLDREFRTNELKDWVKKLEGRK